MSIRPIALVVLAVVSASQASAGVIYDGGVTDFSSSHLSDFAFPQQAADDFILSEGASTITDVHWSGTYGEIPSLPTDDFSIRIFEDSAGAPAISPLVDLNVGNVGRTPSGDLFNGVEVFSYQVDIAPLTLTPDTTYWLSIVNNTVPGTAFDVYWDWMRGESSTGDSFIALRNFEGNPWNGIIFADPTSLDFQLTDDNLITVPEVPEPASIATWALLGLGAIGFRRRRKLVAEDR